MEFLENMKEFLYKAKNIVGNITIEEAIEKIDLLIDDLRKL